MSDRASDVSRAVEVLAATPGVLQQLMAGLPAETAEAPLDGGWSPRDVVAHLLVASEHGAIGRIRRVLEEERPALPAYDEDAELQRSGLRTERLGELLVTFATRRAADVAWLREVPAEHFARTGEHSEVGILSASELLQHAAYHDCLHVEQVAAMLKGIFDPLRGPMSAY
ncbi:MAG: hypothetical protein GEU80_10960 [Dehalococcoidia bacterium]|nr:hypothetical protein [Dehalococcoidia bacterium]